MVKGLRKKKIIHKTNKLQKQPNRQGSQQKAVLIFLKSRSNYTKTRLASTMKITVTRLRRNQRDQLSPQHNSLIIIKRRNGSNKFTGRKVVDKLSKNMLGGIINFNMKPSIRQHTSSNPKLSRTGKMNQKQRSSNITKGQ